MKIYIVVEGDAYTGYENIKAFFKKEAAEKFIDEYTNELASYSNDYHIEEREIE